MSHEGVGRERTVGRMAGMMAAGALVEGLKRHLFVMKVVAKVVHNVAYY